MLLEGPLYRHGKQWRQIVLKFPLFYRSLGSRRPHEESGLLTQQIITNSITLS